MPADTTPIGTEGVGESALAVPVPAGLLRMGLRRWPVAPRPPQGVPVAPAAPGPGGGPRRP